MKAFVTGAGGFVGRALCDRLRRDGWDVVSLRRALPEGGAESGTIYRDLDSPEPWDETLHGIDVVFHLAAHVHQMDGGESAVFFRVNAGATARLAAAALRAGVKRFVFLSSVKVHGESSGDSPFRETDSLHPADAYGKSKLAGELELLRLGVEGLSFVIVRSPLVYGPGVRANFLSLMKIVDRGLPLPLASIRNQRSLIYIGNLVGALVTLASSPAAGGETFLVSDGQDLSTPDLVRHLAAALSRPARLLPVSPLILRGGASLLGKTATAERLTGSLAVDTSALREKTGWRPPFTVDEGLRATAAWYRERFR